MKLAEHATFNDALSQCLKICIYKISFWNETLNEIYGNIFVVLERRGGNIFNVIQFTKFQNLHFTLQFLVLVFWATAMFWYKSAVTLI